MLTLFGPLLRLHCPFWTLSWSIDLISSFFFFFSLWPITDWCQAVWSDVSINSVSILIPCEHTHKNTQHRDSAPHFREHLIPSLPHQHIILPLSSLPCLIPRFFLSSFHPNFNNLHPVLEEQLDNKSSLKGHPPSMFTLGSYETVKRPVVSLPGSS